MGYIKSATTTTIRIQLTEDARERMLTSSNFMGLFDKFGISDSDIDYRNTQKHADTTTTSNNSAQLGFLPDVTGNDTTFRNAVSSGYKQKDFVHVTPASSNVITSPKKYVALGFLNKNNQVDYYRDNIEIDVYLHDYFVLCKLLASRYINDHKQVLSSNPTGITQAFNTYFSDTLDVKNTTDYDQLLNTLSQYGVTQYLNFWDSIKIYDGTSLRGGTIKLVADKDYSYYNSLALAGGAFMNRGEHNGIDYAGTNIKGTKIASPFSMVFTPGLNESSSRYIRGTGSAGIGFGAYDTGYVNAGGLSAWDSNTNAYPMFNMNSTLNGWSSEQYDIKSVFVGFVTSIDMESVVTTNTGGFGDKGYDNITTTIPSARLVLNVATSDLSPTYYPIKIERLTTQVGGYINVNGRENKGIQITETTNPVDTFGLMLGSLEYSSSWNRSQQGLLSSSPYFNLYPSKDNGEVSVAARVTSQQQPYYTLATRMMKMADGIFVNVGGQNNNFWQTDTYSGGFKSGVSGASLTDYNISIPIRWQIFSVADPSAAPCTVTVRFKFNKKAVTNSISYNNVDSQNYYRIYDNATFKWYGEAGADQTSYSDDPRGHGYTTGSTYAWQTEGGKSLYRKLISGQKIQI